MALMLSSVLMKPAISTITLAMSLFADGRLSSGAYVTYTALMPRLSDDVTCIYVMIDILWLDDVYD